MLVGNFAEINSFQTVRRSNFLLEKYILFFLKRKISFNENACMRYFGLILFGKTFTIFKLFQFFIFWVLLGTYSIEPANQRVFISNILVWKVLYWSIKLQYRFEFYNKSSCFKGGRVNFSISPFNLPMHIFPKVISVNLQEDHQIKTSLTTSWDYVTGLKMKEICILFLNYLNKWSP